MEEPLDDHSFEEFLKGRLENLEADPAADAWDKIFGEISQDSPTPVQKKPWLIRKLWILAACMLWFVPQDTHHIVLQNNSSPIIAQNQGKYATANVKQKTPDTKNSQQAQMIGSSSLATNRPQITSKQENSTPQNQPMTTDDKHKKAGYQHSGVNNIKKKQPQAKTPQKMLGHTLNRRKATTRSDATTPTKKQVAKTPSDNQLTKKSKLVVTSKTVLRPPAKNTRTRLQIPLMQPNNVSKLAFVPYRQAELQKVSVPKQKKKTPRGLLLKAFVAPNYNAYRLTTNKADDEVIQSLAQNKVFSSNNLGFSGGIMLESHLSRRWSVIWGLSYTELNSQIRYNSSNALPDSISVNVINSSRIEVTPIYNTETKNYRYKYQDIGVQFGVNYLLFGKGWQHQLYLGAAANRVTNTITQTQDEVVKESSSRVQPMINVGYDMRIPLGKRFGFYLKPTFNYYLNAINQANTAYEVKPFFTSLRLGLVWKLK